MVNRTYAEYKGKIYKWNELLDKLNLGNDGYSSGRIQFYNQASSKQLENTRCLIKDDGGEYVEICNDCEELIEDCICVNEEEIEYNKKHCEKCGESIDNCLCDIEEESDISNDNYVDKKIKRKCLVEPATRDEIVNKFNNYEGIEKHKNNKVETCNESDDYITSNGKKTITRAQLPSGEIITWVELLRRCNLPHRGGSAYVNWLSYKSKDVEGRLPDVKRVDFNGNDVNIKNRRIPVTQYEKIMCWDRYFPKISVGLCPCCEEITITHDYFHAGHNIPVSKGGTNDIKNLIPICGRCNGRMSDSYTIVEFKMKYYPNSKRKLLV